MTRQRWRPLASGIAVSLGVLLSACSSTHPRADAASPAAAPSLPEPYTRLFRPDTNTVELQIAVRKFVPERRRGPALWLVGTSHIGDPEYYASLQKILDARTVVLFEGVNSGSHPRHAREEEDANPPAPPPAQGASSEPGIQSTLAKSLGLVFQLDAIDYDRTNFLNSDLSIQELQQLMASSAGAGSNGAPGGASSPSFDFLMQVMDGSSFLGSMMKLGLEFLGSDRQLQAITKLTLIETIGELKDDFANVHGVPPDLQRLIQVLIEARNQRVIEDFKMQSGRIPRSGSIAIFYGTGHMADMEMRVTGQLHYRPAGDIWLTAFSEKLDQTGLSASQLETVQNLVKWQMEQLRGQ